MERRKHRSLFFGITARALMLAAAGLLVLSYVSVLFNPAKAWIMAIFGLLYVPLVILNVLLLIWALSRRSKAVVIPLLALVPTLFVMGRYYQFKGSDGADAEGVRIVSYNVGRFALPSGKEEIGREACADSVMNLLRSLDADIICLQEFYMKDAGAVRRYLETNFRGYDIEYFVFPTADGCYGNVSLSRYKAKDKGKLDFEGSANLAIYCDYDIGDTRLRVYNCHFQSYNISPSGIVQAVKGDYRKAFRDTEERMKSSITLRPKQVDQVMENIDNCPVDAIVTGDFNDTPMSYTYHRLKKGRKDSFVEAGKGAGATFSLLRPFLRIDYILSPEQFPVTGHEVLKTPFSDHYPIVANITI